MSKGEDTRSLIIHKAAALFNVMGYEGCSLSDIMRETQLKKGGIYNHFKSKEEIALEAFEYGHKLTFKRFRDELDTCETPIDKLYAVINVFESLTTHPVLPGGCPIMTAAMETTDGHEFLQERAKKSIYTLHEYIRIKIEEAKDAKQLKASTNSESLSTIIISALEGALLFSRSCKDNLFINNTVIEIKDLIASKIR